MTVADRRATSLVATLEDLAVLVRRLPAEPEIGLNAAAALRACAFEGPQRISELRERLGVSQPAVTQLVDRLVEQGWAVRVADDVDRRAVRVAPTAAGRDVLEQRRASRARALDRLLGQLDPDDRKRLRAALPALRHLTHLSI